MAGSSALAACSGVPVQSRGSRGYQELHKNTSAGRETVLVCMPETRQTQQAWTGLNDELGQEFALVAVRIEGRDDDPVIAEAVKRHRPASVVLMNNPTVTAYRRYESALNPKQRVPNVAIMTSFLQARRLGPNATGVAYEIPLITSVTHLRKILLERIDRVGVIYRQSLGRFVSDQRELAAREQISIVGEAVSETPNESEIKSALRTLKQKTDAVWVLNDDHLLTPQLISKGWLPGLNERPWRPAIVGAESLVAAELSFGTFAVLPDHTELGTQAANVIFDIADEGWRLPNAYQTQEPLSIKTTLDLVQVRERFHLLPDALAHVDRVLK
jgi:putative ABC transport system substrate-binding protein